MSRVLTALLTLALAAPAESAQTRKPIEARDGDLVIVRDAARVRVVRRVDGNVRTIYNSAQRWLVVLVDEARSGTAPDGRVDYTYNFRDLEGEWPLGDRWDGVATIDDYSIAGEMGNLGMGLTTPGGVVQILGGLRSPRDARAFFKDTAAVATVTFSGSGRGGAGSGGASVTFDQAEERQVAVAMRNVAGMPPSSNSLSFTAGVTGGALPPPPPAGAYPAPTAPVRVGGTIGTPRKLQDAQPVMPAIASQANVRGVVIVEIVIAADGRVSDAKILRSIPLLDQAALDTVRQWRYEPTLLNGAPVPVIMTVTVNFP